MIDKRTWDEFRNAGLLWWVNRLLHLCGWAIVVCVEQDGSISEVYPARVKFRGFDCESESDGFVKLTRYMADIASELLQEAQS
jgi:hypothetical protein